MVFDAAVQTVLEEYERRAAREVRQWNALEPNQFVQVRDRFLLAVGAATGSFINLLVREMKPKTILEIGTSYGYSTLWLAEAARAVGSKVITLELQAEKQEYARGQLAKAGLGGWVEFRPGDALESIAQLDGPIGFVLLDLWKDLYIPCFNLFLPKLGPGALVVADNMLSPESARKPAAAYREHVRAAPGIQSMLLEIGQGLEVSRCVRGLDPGVL
jgi:predicted O-methyltransferase YrrM